LQCGLEEQQRRPALPGSDGDAAGYVIKLNAPIMENGSTEDEPGLLTVPRDSNNGIISGQYPSFTVKKRDAFALWSIVSVTQRNAM